MLISFLVTHFLYHIAHLLMDSLIHVLFNRDMGLDLYRKHIMSNDVVQTRTVEGLLLLIEKER